MRNEELILIKKEETISAEELWKEFKKVMPEHRYKIFIENSVSYHRIKDKKNWVQSFCLDGEYEEQNSSVFVECLPWASSESLYQEIGRALMDYGTPRQRPRQLKKYYDLIIFKCVDIEKYKKFSSNIFKKDPM